jgi:hypothetical protein
MHFANNRMKPSFYPQNPPFFKRSFKRLFSSLAFWPWWPFSSPAAVLSSSPAATLHAAAAGIARAFRFSVCSWCIYVKSFSKSCHLFVASSSNKVNWPAKIFVPVFVSLLRKTNCGYVILVSTRKTIQKPSSVLGMPIPCSIMGAGLGWINLD